MSQSLKIRVALALGLLIIVTLAYNKLEEFANRPPTVPDNVRIVDGDRLELDGMRYSLFGIDAPELPQVCNVGPERYACGRGAKAALYALFVKAEQISCTKRGEDSDGWIRAVCLVNGLDVNGEMVRQGQALANRDESFIYVDEEEAAMNQEVGLWAGDFQDPWEWRAAQAEKTKIKKKKRK